MSKKYIFGGLVALALVLAALAFFSFGKNSTSTSSTESAEYPLLAKRLFIENPNDTRINFSPLRKQLKEYFGEQDLTGSMYFEYLPTGTSIRINGDDKFRAASLIKLPVAMELYKSAELGRLDLDSKIRLKQEWLNDGYGSLYQKGAGHELSLRDAAKIMLTESDNTALRAILSSTEGKLDTSEMALGSLDIDFTLNQDSTIDIGSRSYSSFFKCLYFACYNTKENSQEILQFLTKTDSPNRIVAGIDDKSIPVAHKIGVFNTKVQSDCGIVYADKNNYSICVILNGDDDKKTNNHISELSKIVYQYINNQ